MSGYSNALKLVVFAIDEFVPLGSKDRLWLVFQVCLMVGVELSKWSYVNFILVCMYVCVCEGLPLRPTLCSIPF